MKPMIYSFIIYHLIGLMYCDGNIPSDEARDAKSITSKSAGMIQQALNHPCKFKISENL